MINLNGSTPAALSGSNVQWQSDASGNVSAYLATRKVQVSPSANAIMLDASMGDSFWITVNADITSMAISNPYDGQEITIIWAQDATGHSVSVSSNLIGGPTITTTANKHTSGKWSYNLADTNWYFIGQNDM